MPCCAWKFGIKKSIWMRNGKPKLIRITTVPLSLDKLLEGQMRFMKEQGLDVSMVSSGGERITEITLREQCPHYTVDMTRTIAPFRDLKSLVDMVRLFRKLRPDIVHTHTPKAGLIGMLASRICGVPVRMHTVAGLPLMETKGVKRVLLRMTEKLTYLCASRVYPNSFKLMEYMEKIGLAKAAKMKVIAGGSSNGIDTEYFHMNDQLKETARSLRKSYYIPDSVLVFIFIGRIVKDKGIDELLEAFDRLSKTYGQIRLLLVGPFEDELNPITVESRRIIRDNASVLEAGYQQDVRPFLAMSDVLVFPSYREGFPNVPMQAGCLGLALILTDINGCNEIVTREQNGLLVRPKDTGELERAMTRMIGDQALRLSLQAAARETIVTRYKREYVWQSLLKEYKSYAV
jgi:glycosyltransferase involved in cell wall biosynthesis